MNSVLVSRRSPQGDVIVAFSARDTEKGKFTFFSVLAQTNANVIFVNDYSNGWYLNGTPEFKDEGKFVDFLRQQIDSLRHPTQGRLCMLGSSMGAYGALKYGSLLGADKIIAMGPESELCIPLGRSVSSLLDMKEGDGAIYGLRFKNPANVYIFSGSNDIVDYYCACKLADAIPGLAINIINNRTHVVAKYLNAQFGLDNIIQSLFFEDDESFLEKAELGVVVPRDIVTDVKMFNEKLSGGTVDSSYAPSIAHAAALYPAWSMIHYFKGLIEEKAGNRENAMECMRAALQAQESLGRARLKLASLLCESGELEAARLHLEKLLESVATYGVCWMLASVHEKLGDVDAAIAVLQKLLSADINEKQKSQARTRIGLLEKFLKDNHFSAARRRCLDSARAVVADFDLMPFNYSDFSKAAHAQITVKNPGENQVFFKGLHSHANVCVDFGGHRRSRVYLGKNIRGRVDIKIGGDDCIVYVGNNVDLRGVKISVVQGGGMVVVGNDVTALSDNVWQCGGSVEAAADEFVAPVIVGDDCFFSSGTGLFSADELAVFSPDGLEQLNKPDAALLIEPHAWLGRGVTVLKNSSVGACSIVEAGSVVKGALPRCSMAIGVPAAAYCETEGAWARSSAPSHLQRARHYHALYSASKATSTETYSMPLELRSGAVALAE